VGVEAEGDFAAGGDQDDLGRAAAVGQGVAAAGQAGGGSVAGAVQGRQGLAREDQAGGDDAGAS
jgi:hypothetical protein